MTDSTTPKTSLLEPLKERWFAALWLTSLVSNIGSWMNDVAASWMMTGLTTSPFMVSLVQAATSLPVFLMALPAGAMADLVNRKHYLLTIQTVLVFVGIGLATCTFLGLTGPWLLIAFIFMLGMGSALTLPAWQAVVPEIVSTQNLSGAITLNGVNVNLARAIGPAVGGLIVAAAGPAWVFGLNAFSFIVIVVTLSLWPYQRKVSKLPAEELSVAIIGGLRYVLFARDFRCILVKVALFMLGAAALWALLPLIARGRLGLDASGYGLLMGSLGVGAVTAAFTLPKLRTSVSTERILLVAAVVFAAITAAMAFISSPALAMLCTFLGGACWLTLLTTYNTMAQYRLPEWVRGRALSVYLITLFGGLSLGSLLWGSVASFVGIGTALAAAAAVQVVGLLISSRLIIAMPDDGCLIPSENWPEHEFELAAESNAAVLIQKTYQVAAENLDDFKTLMWRMREVRLRDGAVHWSLYCNPENELEQTEAFLHPSWDHHVRSHARFTREDAAIETQLKALQIEPTYPKISHLLRHAAIKLKTT